MTLADLHIPHEINAPLAQHTWYGVGGHADVLAHPTSVEQLVELAARLRRQGLPLYVLGSGANLLVSDTGVRGVVVKLDDPCFRQLRIDATAVTVGAGYDLARLVLQTAKAGLGGLECLAGVPASVGGAVRMNAGGRFGDIGHSVRRVRILNGQAQLLWLSREVLEFGYRTSNIPPGIILEVDLELTPGDPEALTSEVKRIFTLKKESQPLADHSAGCRVQESTAGA